jgi:type I restriction enzyme M protein
MSTAAQTIVQRLWNYCNLLRDDGMSYGDYVEQLTYLLFLKMAYERTRPPYNQPSRIPQGYDWEIVDNTARLCVMNLFLHGMSSDEQGASPIRVADSLRSHPGEYFDIVLTNPPFGRKSSVTFVNEEGREEREASVIVRDDFWASTSNKQLNFVQHIKSLLRIHGRAAMVVPDNVLFFDKKPASPNHWTERLWVYDLRTNQNFTLKTNPLARTHLDDFVACYHAENRHERQQRERFHSFSYDELLKKDKVSLDLFWLRDESLEGADSLASPDVLAASIVEDLQAALEQFTAIADDLGGGMVIGGK